MKGIFLCLAVAALVCGQDASSSQTYVYDGLGNRTRATQSDIRGDSRTETAQSINGRSVPLEQVEERVLRSDGTTKVVERIVRKFDPTGRLSQTDRIVEEQTQLSGGGSTVRATTYRGDLNGNMQPVERSLTETRKSGTVLTSDALIERPSMSGGFETAEKRSIVNDVTPSRELRQTVVYRRDGDGRFYEAVKETVDRQESDGRSVENTAQYVVGTSGRLELAAQTVKTAVKRKDGSESIVVDVYAQETPGLANSGGKPKLKQEQLIERRSRGGEVDEVVSLREPSMADPDRLGPPRKLKETVCRGKCED
jgi:hypothetical protein